MEFLHTDTINFCPSGLKNLIAQDKLLAAFF